MDKVERNLKIMIVLMAIIFVLRVVVLILQWQ
jgi:hypothetical protein